MKIVFDIGHGMSNRKNGVYDPGAVGNGYQEHNIVNGMAMRLKGDFEALGWQVMITGDEYLGNRVRRAKAWGADILISLHCNASISKSVSGVECWVDPKASTGAKKIAYFICSKLSGTMKIRNRGVKSKWFTLLRGRMHDVLVELFFITNRNDVNAYQKNVDKVELDLVNSILLGMGYKAVTSLPRKWN